LLAVLLLETAPGNRTIDLYVRLAMPSTLFRRALSCALLACLAAACSSDPQSRPPSGPHAYGFADAAPTGGPDAPWVVYDTTNTSDPHARVPSLVSVSHGVLHVMTTGDQGSGLCLCGPTAKPAKPYGRWDVRARASVNADHGFAILLWPNSNRWPQDGEIDFAEFPGENRSLLQTTVHYGADNHTIMKFTHGDFARWHTYSVVWRPSALTFLLDGRTVLRVTDRAAIPSTPMHLALQAGVDSGVSIPSDTTATLDVTQVRVSG
jgi:hypothetical protein